MPTTAITRTFTAREVGYFLAKQVQKEMHLRSGRYEILVKFIAASDGTPSGVLVTMTPKEAS